MRTSRHVQERASRAADPLLLLLYKQEREVNLHFSVHNLHLLDHYRPILPKLEWHVTDRQFYHTKMQLKPRFLKEIISPQKVFVSALV